MYRLNTFLVLEFFYVVFWTRVWLRGLGKHDSNSLLSLSKNRNSMFFQSLVLLLWLFCFNSKIVNIFSCCKKPKTDLVNFLWKVDVFSKKKTKLYCYHPGRFHYITAIFDVKRVNIFFSRSVLKINFLMFKTDREKWIIYSKPRVEKLLFLKSECQKTDVTMKSSWSWLAIRLVAIEFSLFFDENVHFPNKIQ
jgi:hypothetical protein